MRGRFFRLKGSWSRGGAWCPLFLAGVDVFPQEWLLGRGAGSVVQLAASAACFLVCCVLQLVRRCRCLLRRKSVGSTCLAPHSDKEPGSVNRPRRFSNRRQRLPLSNTANAGTADPLKRHCSAAARHRPSSPLPPDTAPSLFRWAPLFASFPHQTPAVRPFRFHQAAGVANQRSQTKERGAWLCRSMAAAPSPGSIPW